MLVVVKKTNEKGDISNENKVKVNYYFIFFYSHDESHANTSHGRRD